MAAARTVRAARLVAHGAPLVVEEVGLAPAGEGEAVVEMAYGSVNPVDRYIALGRVAPDAPLPRTIGVEGVGRINGRWVALHGEGLGTRRDGVWAEAAAVPLGASVDVPEGVEPEAAAAMGVAGVTAWRTVTELARVTPQDRVLVLGASGGVGSMIVSLVRSIGAEVWGQTGSPSKAEVVRARGASRVVVAADGASVAAAVASLEPTVVFDPLGGEFTGGAIEALSPRGRHVIFGTSADAEGRLHLQAVYRKSLRILGYGGLMEPAAALRRGMDEALRALREGRIEVAIDSVLPLDDVNVALERLATRQVSGKLLLALGG